MICIFTSIIVGEARQQGACARQKVLVPPTQQRRCRVLAILSSLLEYLLITVVHNIFSYMYVLKPFGYNGVQAVT